MPDTASYAPFGTEPADTPTFTVVIPALNEEARLPQCLASVASQVPDFSVEVLVVDNGSTDRTAEVARAAGVRVVSCARRGAVLARQMGLERARGEILVHLDADSLLPSSTLQLLARHFANPGISAVVGDVQYVPGILGIRGMSKLYRSANTFLNAIWGRPFFALAGALAMRREALVCSGGYATELPHSGDEAGILARLSKQGKIVWEPRFVVVSSDRRFRNRFGRWLTRDLLLHTFLDQTFHRVTKRSRWGDRPAIR